MVGANCMLFADWPTVQEVVLKIHGDRCVFILDYIASVES